MLDSRAPLHARNALASLPDGHNVVAPLAVAIEERAGARRLLLEAPSCPRPRRRARSPQARPGCGATGYVIEFRNALLDRA